MTLDNQEQIERAHQVDRVFARIVSRYDLMNRIITLGLDGIWRKMAAEVAAIPDGGRALDVGCGTGELTIALARDGSPEVIVGLDRSPEMLALAGEKARLAGVDRTSFMLGDALALPFSDDTFDAATLGFALRNVVDVQQALREMQRVVKPAGRVVCLELSNYRSFPISLLQQAYLRWIVPQIGRLVTGDPAAYVYLADSVERFHSAHELAQMMAMAKLRGIRFRRLGFGAVALHVAIK